MGEVKKQGTGKSNALKNHFKTWDVKPKPKSVSQQGRPALTTHRLVADSISTRMKYTSLISQFIWQTSFLSTVCQSAFPILCDIQCHRFIAKTKKTLLSSRVSLCSLLSITKWCNSCSCLRTYYILVIMFLMTSATVVESVSSDNQMKSFALWNGDLELLAL